MRAKFCGALMVALAVWGISETASVRRVEATSASSGAGGELITLSASLADSGQQLIVIDPKLRALSVYHVHGATGEIALKSVRNFHWDLQLSHFNNTSLTPPEIRSLLEQPAVPGR